MARLEWKIVVSNGALGVAAAASAALLAYAVWSRSPATVTTAQLARHYALPLALAIVLGASLMLEAEKKANLLVTLTSVGISLLLAELLLALSPPPDIARSIGKETSVYDPRNAVESALSLGTSAVTAFPHLPASVARTLRVEVAGKEMITLSGGLADTTTVFCNDSGQWEVYRADQYGFNNDPEAWDYERHEIVLIGDSYAQGWCVPREQNVAATLALSWPSTLNLGASAAGPLTELAILREFAVDLAPRNVVWLYYEGNDLADLAAESDDPILRRYLDPGFTQGLKQRQAELDARLEDRLRELITAAAAEGENGESLRALGGAHLTSPWRLGRLRRVETLLFGAPVPFPTRRSRLRQLPEILALADAITHGWGGKLYFAYLPEYSRYRSRVGEAGTERREVLELVDRLNIPLIDMAAVFDDLEEPSRMWLHPAGHYGAEGYRAVGRQIVASIRRQEAAEGLR